MRTHTGSVRDRLQRCSLMGFRLPTRIYPHNRKWRYRAERDERRLRSMIDDYRRLCDDLERALDKTGWTRAKP